MNCIINVRGTSGSGKTTAMRNILDYHPHAKVVSNDEQGRERVLGYKIDLRERGVHKPVVLIGSYENTCGGTDGINKQQWIGDRVEAAYRAGNHVLLEGLLMSKSGPGGHLAPRLHALGRCYLLYLDTPLQLCIQHVLDRRAAAGNTKEFDPYKTLAPAHKQVHKSKVLLDQTGEGYITRDIPWQTAHKSIIECMLEAEGM